MSKTPAPKTFTNATAIFLRRLSLDQVEDLFDALLYPHYIQDAAECREVSTRLIADLAREKYPPNIDAVGQVAAHVTPLLLTLTPRLIDVIQRQLYVGLENPENDRIHDRLTKLLKMAPAQHAEHLRRVEQARQDECEAREHAEHLDSLYR